MITLSRQSQSFVRETLACMVHLEACRHLGRATVVEAAVAMSTLLRACRKITSLKEKNYSKRQGWCTWAWESGCACGWYFRVNPDVRTCIKTRSIPSRKDKYLSWSTVMFSCACTFAHLDTATVGRRTTVETVCKWMLITTNSECKRIKR